MQIPAWAISLVVWLFLTVGTAFGAGPWNEEFSQIWSVFRHSEWCISVIVMITGVGTLLCVQWVIRRVRLALAFRRGV